MDIENALLETVSSRRVGGWVGIWYFFFSSVSLKLPLIFTVAVVTAERSSAWFFFCFRLFRLHLIDFQKLCNILNEKKIKKSVRYSVAYTWNFGLQNDLPKFIYTWADYTRELKQRCAILKFTKHLHYIWCVFRQMKNG